jgi:hypothetical protein
VESVVPADESGKESSMTRALQCIKKMKRKIGPLTCGRAAVEYEVVGSSFSARAILCDRHAKYAKQEGFKLRPLGPLEQA